MRFFFRLPNSLGYLSNLQNLQLEGNILKSIRQDVIKGGTIRLLKHLRDNIDEENMAKLKIKDHAAEIPKSTFPDKYVMRNNKSLNLQMKDLSSIPDSVFLDAQTAEVNLIDLSKNKLTSIPNGLKHLRDFLTELNLSKNQLKEIPEFIAELHRLQYLDVGSNLLSDLPQNLSNLLYLREVVISNNKFTKIPESIYEVESLEILLASDNQIVEINVPGLAKLKRLATLDLGNNNIGHVPPELGNLKQLRNLELKGNCFRQPRYAILEQGTESILCYLRDRIPK